MAVSTTDRDSWVKEFNVSCGWNKIWMPIIPSCRDPSDCVDPPSRYDIFSTFEEDPQKQTVVDATVDYSCKSKHNFTMKKYHFFILLPNL